MCFTLGSLWAENIIYFNGWCQVNGEDKGGESLSFPHPLICTADPQLH